MSYPILVSSGFDGGFQSDISREHLSPNVAFRMRDYIPENEASLRKRGGYPWASHDFGSTYMMAVGWAPFAGDPHLLAVKNDGMVSNIKTFDSTGGADISTSGFTAMSHKPFWHRDRMILLQGLTSGAADPKKYYDSGGGVYAVSAVGGTPPQARVGTSWGDYLLLANGYVGGTLYNYRIWPSAVGNPDSFSTGTSFFDFNREIVALVVIRNVIVVFHYDEMWELLGDTPPPGGNWAKKFLYSQGTFDGRSVTTFKEFVLWANNSGVWKTDGATLTDLTEQAGVSLYWRKLVKAFSFQQGWSAVGGVVYGQYMISITDNNGVHVTTMVFDLERQTSHEYTNIKAAMFAERASGPGTSLVDGHEELFFAHRSLPRVGALSGIWTPGSTNAYDADGTAVQPSIETPFYKPSFLVSRRRYTSPALKRFVSALIGYDLRALAGVNVNLAVSAVFSPEDTNYRSLTPLPPATSAENRPRVDIRQKAYGIGFKIDQQGPSSDTRVYDIELSGHLLESSRQK